MSFTVKVKEDILQSSKSSQSELSAIIKMSGNLGITSKGLTLAIASENAKIARHIYSIIETFAGLQPEIKYHYKTNLKKIEYIQYFLMTKLISYYQT